MVTIFEVEHGGMLTTIQDLGRYGYQKYGLSTSGALDRYAHQMANILVCNNLHEATLEITLMGLKLRALRNTVVAITGGDLTPLINGKRAPMWTSFKVKENDLLHFKGCISGCRAYLAIAGGIKIEKALGSRATDLLSRLGGMEGRPLKKGDIIASNHLSEKYLSRALRRKAPPELIPKYKSETKVRVILGPQIESFTEKGIDTFLNSTYKVALDSDRMACRLEGNEIEHKEKADIRSEGMFTGAIQVPQNGLPIVFQSGRPSVGGYTKIGGVITVDQPKIAQLKPGDYVRFERIDLKQAHHLYREKRKIFNILKMSW